ncbi:ORF68 [Ranid herpesvirus 2]|uniref:ORF68 n=1 Tax=Ranid herpesvirus 2 TaxID=389214 RepID=Q14W38_9VIRU|nr:ORF68 [Ranid herpesvirus 2]ABG25669.1 ORF68 [Ranid herpesvirus 2]
MALVDPFRRHVALFARSEAIEAKRLKAKYKLEHINRFPVVKAGLIFDHGVSGLQLLMAKLNKEAQTDISDSVWVYRRLNLMLDCVFHLLKDEGDMRMEDFQRELLRATVLGVATKQLGTQIFKYKHLLLHRLELADPDIICYNPEAPSVYTSAKIDEIFNVYAKPYTAATVPRRCGKSTIMAIIISAAIMFLEIDIVIQAHRKETCLTFSNKIRTYVEQLQTRPWFPSEFRIHSLQGTAENLIYTSDPAVKAKPSTCHFMASGSNSARGQNPDLVIVDEAGFVNKGAFLSVLPLMAVKGTKQIHISSHVDKDAWLSRLGEVIDPITGKAGVHLIKSQFKCDMHAADSGVTCACNDYLCPDHMTVDDVLKQILELVVPGSFDTELTGCVVGDVNGGGTNSKPFETVVTKLLANCVTDVDQSQIQAFYIGVDPTYGAHTMSSVGVCTIVRLNAETCSGPYMLIVGLDEVPLASVKESVYKAHAAIVLRHVMLLHKLFPAALARGKPIMVIMEQNTYTACNSLVTCTITEYAAKSGIHVEIYKENDQVGFQTTRASKLTATICAARAIAQDTLSYTVNVFSGGDSLLKAIKESDEALEDCLSKDAPASAEGLLDPDMYLLPPESHTDVALMHDCQKRIYMKEFRNLVDVALIPPTHDCFRAGVEQLRNLCTQLLQVEIEVTGKEPKVITGGKKPSKDKYSRDDLFAAFFIATELASRNAALCG